MTPASFGWACALTFRSGLKKRVTSGVLLRLKAASGSESGLQASKSLGNQFDANGWSAAWASAAFAPAMVNAKEIRRRAHGCIPWPYRRFQSAKSRYLHLIEWFYRLPGRVTRPRGEKPRSRRLLPFTTTSND